MFCSVHQQEVNFCCQSNKLHNLFQDILPLHSYGSLKYNLANWYLPFNQMFENSILTNPNLICQYHPKCKITHVCTDLGCLSNPLLCPSCLSDFDFKNKHAYHQSQLKSCWEGFNELAAHVQKDRIALERVYREAVIKKENEQLIKWQQDRQRHYGSIENHINSLKYQLQEEIKGISRLFEQAVMEARQRICQDLDAYCKIYKDNFETFSRMIDPLVIYGRSYKYYANVNNITLKLVTDSRVKGTEWLSGLKANITATQKIAARILPFRQSLDKASLYMNSVIDNLPTVRFDEQKITKLVKYTSMEALKTNLIIPDLKSLNFILSAGSGGSAYQADSPEVQGRKNAIFTNKSQKNTK